MSEKKFRVTFFDNCNQGKDISEDVDIVAVDLDDATRKACKLPQAKSGKYTDITVGEIPVGASTIGIEFMYEDTYMKKNFHGYLFIRAESEKQAADYYNKNLKGTNFWFRPGKIEADGKNVRGKIVKTYYAGFPDYNFDATTDVA